MGLIGGVDDTLAQLLPEDVDVMSAEVQATTLRQLLTMNAGFAPEAGGARCSGFTQSKNWVREILANPESPPGQGFEYSNDTSHLLAAIVEQATGTSPLDYARKRLFGPLGIDTTPAWTEEIMRGNIDAYEKAGFAWPTGPAGHQHRLVAAQAAIARHGEAGTALPRRRPVGGQADRPEGVGRRGNHAADRSFGSRTSATATSGGPATWMATGRSGRWGTAARLIVVVPHRDLVVATTSRAPADRPEQPRHRRRRPPRDHRGCRGLAIPAHELIRRPAGRPHDRRRGHRGGMSHHFMPDGRDWGGLRAPGA